jgi:hypothetical protein
LDAEFTSIGVVVAFVDGGYEQGPRAGVAASVPELSNINLLLDGLSGLLRIRTVR